MGIIGIIRSYISSFFFPPKRNIVLIGNSGIGKSSAGNTILRKKEFTTKVSANAVTTKCLRRENTSKNISVVDTPDFFDTDDDDMVKSEIVRAMVECAEGVHAFVIVLKVGRYTTHEKKIVQEFLNLVKEDMLKHTVILFTHGDQLEDQTIEEFVKTSPQLQELVDKCGGRHHVIDNKYWNKSKQVNNNRVQVNHLLDTIDKMVKENGCYTNELLKRLEKQIQKEMKKNEDNLSPEEKREKAKDSVYRKFLSLVVEIGKFALVGAFMGVFNEVVDLKCLTEAITEPMVGKIASKIIGAGVEGAAKAVTAGFKPYKKKN
ncbi:hypothetical protein R3I94_001212 [Phoxinus phoxinus]